MQGQQDGGGQAAQGAKHGQLGADVEVVGGLVQDEEGWLLGEGAGDEDALALAAGEPVEGAVGQVDGVDRDEGGVDEFGVFGGVTGEEAYVRSAAHGDDLADGQVEVGGRVLDHCRHGAGQNHLVISSGATSWVPRAMAK